MHKLLRSKLNLIGRLNRQIRVTEAALGADKRRLRVNYRVFNWRLQARCRQPGTLLAGFLAGVLFGQLGASRSAARASGRTSLLSTLLSMGLRMGLQSMMSSGLQPPAPGSPGHAPYSDQQHTSERALS
ncbi:MAG: hypothetical protein R3F53_27555 [Gammaproteobacteria bacterium]